MFYDLMYEHYEYQTWLLNTIYFNFVKNIIMIIQQILK
jgi:hypothetical protein